MKLNIKELLDFFDDKKDSQKGDANALISLLGEDLNASVYKHFRNNVVEILDDSVLPGTNKGNRLDRWIFDKKDNKLFQCEIKNWATTAIGGKQLKSDASEEETKKVVNHYWKHQLNGDLSKYPSNVTKVLSKMKLPGKYNNISKVEPLLIYWMPISSNKDGLDPLSTISVKSLNLPIETEFSELSIFSVSLYLRQLYINGEKTIDLEMPHLKHRMEIFDRLKNINLLV